MNIPRASIKSIPGIHHTQLVLLLILSSCQVFLDCLLVLETVVIYNHRYRHSQLLSIPVWRGNRSNQTANDKWLILKESSKDSYMYFYVSILLPLFEPVITHIAISIV